MEKQSNTIDNYYSKIPRPAPSQMHSNRKENIYEVAMKRKFLNVSVGAPGNRRTLSPPNSMSRDNKDEIIKRQKLEIEELQVKQTKFKKTQTEMLKMLHDYRLRLLRKEKSSAQNTKILQPAALNMLSEDEITEEQMREFFTDSDLVQLNSISKLKSSDRAYARKLFECLYRDDLDSLYTRTLSSKSKSGKTPITPKKMQVIKKMMLDRYSRSDDEIDKLERTAPVYGSVVLSDALFAVRNKYALGQK